MTIRNYVFIALAADATPEEIENGHNLIDRIYGAEGRAPGGVDPAYLINQSVAATNNGVTAHGQTIPAPPATTPPAASGDQLPGDVPGMRDANGLPYDERIHSSNKKFTDKGVWTARRGVDPNTRARVEAELRAAIAAGGGVAAAPPALPQQAPPALPMPGAIATPPPLPQVQQDTPYTQFCRFIGENDARIPADWLKQVLSAYGVPEGSLQNLAHMPDVVPTAHQFIANALATAP